MKIVVYGPEKRTGILHNADVVDVTGACAKYLGEKKGERYPALMASALAPSDLLDLIEGGDRALESAQLALDYLYDGAADQRGIDGAAIVQKAHTVKLHAPRPRSARVACAGGNFADHAAAMAAKAAARGEMRAFEGDAHAQIRKTGIWGFWKLDRESVGPDGTVIYPARATRLDYEGELAIVFGKEGKNIKAGDAKSYVWGVTLLGDWSIRLSPEPGPLKFAMQKNFDTSSSIGPCIVTGVSDPFTADVETLVNGERRQHYNTRDMVFSFGEYMEFLSRDFTFYPGDIISGGTAAGTAADSSDLLPDGTPRPERFLKPGDFVEIKSKDIGTLSARVVASS